MENKDNPKIILKLLKKYKNFFKSSCVSVGEKMILWRYKGSEIKEPEITPFFYPEFTTAKVIKCYDGDTITVIARVENAGGKYYKFNCRMFGYNSPEVKGPEKEQGLIARDALKGKILGEIVEVDVHFEKEKYGRLLVSVRKDGVNINEWMVKNGYGKVYMV